MSEANQNHEVSIGLPQMVENLDIKDIKINGVWKVDEKSVVRSNKNSDGIHDTVKGNETLTKEAVNLLFEKSENLNGRGRVVPKVRPEKLNIKESLKAVSQTIIKIGPDAFPTLIEFINDKRKTEGKVPVFANNIITHYKKMGTRDEKFKLLGAMNESRKIK